MRRLFGDISYLPDKLKTFDIAKTLSNWWSTVSIPAKTAFISALIIGFVSHLFIYTGRYYGFDDSGVVRWIWPMFGTGRWFSTVINILSYGYVLPIVIGVFVSLFLAMSALYVCKIFDIQSRLGAVLIGGLLSTFPSIANTNLFLYDTANYHFGVLLGVLAVWCAIKYKFGFLIGGALAVLTLAIYQSKINVVIAISVFYLILQLLKDNFCFKDFKSKLIKIALMIGLGGVIYAVSLPITLHISGNVFNDHGGFSPGSVSERLLSLSGIGYALSETYRYYFNGFFGNIYLIVDALRFVHILLAAVCVLLLAAIIVSNKIYRHVPRLLAIIAFIMVVPLASNFSDLFDLGPAYGLTIYAFVFTYVFIIALCERCKNIFPVIRSLLALCMVLVIANFIIGNNILYLRAHYSNQKTFSLTVRVLDRIEPLLTLTDSRTVTFIGGLPNEYYPVYSGFAPEHRYIRAGFSLFIDSELLGYGERFADGGLLRIIRYNHGIDLDHLNRGDRWDGIAQTVLDTNMPVWPADGSVGIIDDVIVINFGRVDIISGSDESGQFFEARHWISRGHLHHDYRYHWSVYQNGVYHYSTTTDNNMFFFDAEKSGELYCISVVVSNENVNFSYPPASIAVQAAHSLPG